MATNERRRIVVLASAILAMLLGMGAYELWMNTAMRTRPWQLEWYVNVLAARCRTGPGASFFSEELRVLTAQVNEAELCLARTNETWAVSRDYAPCVQSLSRAALFAQRILLSETNRLQEGRARLYASLQSLESEISSDAQAKKSGAKFEIGNSLQSRARTLVKAARNLAALGQTESALLAILHARVTWAQSENFVAAEMARFYDTQHRAQWEVDAQNILLWTKQTGRAAILVDKLEHRCFLLTNGQVAKSYVANLGRNWYRMKVQAQDASTPEGKYKIKSKFRSGSFGWALLLDYPNAADRQRFNSMRKSGEIASRARIGGNIEIHGGGRSNQDWTDGCVSLENSEMADLYKLAYVGMPVTIVGTCRLGAAAKG